jgi:hypothetical protein
MVSTVIKGSSRAMAAAVAKTFGWPMSAAR